MAIETGSRTGCGLLAGLRKSHMAAVLGILSLVGCAQPTQLGRSSLASNPSPEEAIVLPAPGGLSVVGVVERRFTNAIEQQIALATNALVGGQNFIRVQIFGPVGSEAAESALAIPAISDGALAREMRQHLPGVPMSRSPLFVQNDYGPFGYAVGRAGSGDLCFYGWQRIGGASSGAPFSNVGIIHLRMRICQTGASEQSLLAAMYGFTINTAFSARSWNPYGSPPPADPRLGSIGQPIYPVAPAGGATVLDAEPAAPARAPTPRRVTAAPVAAPPERPAVPANAPIVPPPPAAQDSQQAVPVIPSPPAD